MNKNLIKILCILSNLLLGNGILVFFPSSYSSINYYLVIGMSLACIICCIAFFQLNVRKWKTVSLLLLSLALTYCIQFQGVIIATIITKFGLDDPLSILKSILVGFVMAVMGSLIMFPISLVFCAINFYWFYQLRKTLEEKNP